MAQKKMVEMYTEYMIGKNLKHPNIVEYKYFIKEFNPNTKVH